MKTFSLALSLVIASSASAATSETAMKTSAVGQFLKSGRYTSTVHTSLGSGKIYNEGVEIFAVEPSLAGEYGKTLIELSVPMYWTKAEDSITSGETSSRAIGRPEIMVTGPVKKDLRRTVTFGGYVKLPMYSGSAGVLFPEAFGGLHRTWSAGPVMKMNIQPRERRYYFNTATKVEFSGSGEEKFPLNGTRSDLKLERAPIVRFDGSANYKYDNRLEFGTRIVGVATMGEHKLTIRGPIATNIDQSSRDRLSVGVFARYMYKKGAQIIGEISSAVKEEDTIAGSAVAMDELQHVSRVAASVGVMHTF